MTADPYEAAAASAARVAWLTGATAHGAAVVGGSGWAPAADARTAGQPVAGRTEVPLADLGGFAPPTVAGHAAVVRSIGIGRLRVLVFLGRTHLYEGHPVATVVHGVRTAVAAGCRVIVLTNAAGGVPEGLDAGQPGRVSHPLHPTGPSPRA